MFNSLIRKLKKKEKFTPYIWGFESFVAASKCCSGYSKENILNATKEALLKVKNGTAVFERDTVIFDRIEYSWPLLSSLLYIALQKEGKFDILDFGGSLGSTYYQNRKFLKKYSKCWGIVEQQKHVECGKEHFENDSLKFYSSISDFTAENKADAILFSSVLHYLEEPKVYLEKAISAGFEYIIIDRTPVSALPDDLYLIQNVPESIYSASIPMQVFSESRLIESISDKYILMEDWVSTIDGEMSIPDREENAVHKGYLFVKQ